ncbi:MAG: peptidoglycan-associated lipoprotein Pal [Proteobacteria bacterium]|nr:peptidoglycan-associated lipoprotein Pal [Pseudomonadota bacterium]
MSDSVEVKDEPEPEQEMNTDEPSADIDVETFPDEQTYIKPKGPSLDEKMSMSTTEAMKFVNEDVLFDFDSSVLNGNAKNILKKKAVYLEKYPGVSVTIEGHCDERGTNEYNLALGERRAQSAKTFLINLGIASSRLKINSYGEEKPLDPRHNEDAWVKNRRDHFVIEPK